MRPKREMIPTLTLAQNFRLIMSREGLSFKDVGRRAEVSLDTAYRVAEHNVKFVTDQVLRVGKVLGFTQRQVEEKMRLDRLATGRVYSKKGAFYKLIGELVDLYDSNESYKGNLGR